MNVTHPLTPEEGALLTRAVLTEIERDDLRRHRQRLQAANEQLAREVQRLRAAVVEQAAWRLVLPLLVVLILLLALAAWAQ